MNESINHAALPDGYQLREYKLLRILGSGAFGIVYLAEHIDLGHQVAIKEFMPDFAVRKGETLVFPRTQGDDAENYTWGLEAFLKEAKVLFKLKSHNHNSIIEVQGFFRENNTAYMLMEYVIGRPLDLVLKQKNRLSELEVKAILTPLLSGLKHVHKEKTYHRDIKPANIIIKENGQPVLIDFGAAREVLTGKTKQTVMYTPPYGSIEQYQSDGNIGPWTDIYALAVMCYECLTGEAPPEASARTRQGHDPIKPIGSLCPEVSSSFAQSIEIALSVYDDERPQSIEVWLKQFSPKGSENSIRKTIANDSGIEKQTNKPEIINNKEEVDSGLVFFIIFIFLIVLPTFLALMGFFK